MTDETVNTGLAELVTAPVTPPQAPELLPPPREVIPDGWTIHRVAALVRDVAMNLYDLPYTLKKHSLTPEQYERLAENEYFKRALESATIEWNSPHSTNKRLALEAAIALEDALPDVAARLKKANEPLPGVVALANLFAKIAGLGEGKPTEAGTAERFKITINLGGDVHQFDKQRGPIIRLESDGGGSPLQTFLEAPGSPKTV